MAGIERLHPRQSLQTNTAKILQRLDPEIYRSLTCEQKEALKRLLAEITLGSSSQRPKLIDIRFVVDLILTRFYLVLLVGKDQRQQPRQMTGMSKLGNAVAAVLLLIGVNLVVSAILLLTVYLLKSALGIDLLPEHFAHYLKNL